jgi:cystathionine gamma-lyase
MEGIMAEPDEFLNDEDILAHLGDDYSAHNDAVVPPIYMNSLHVTPKEAIDDGRPRPYSYGRASNPTVNVFERKVAALERADRALAFASGMGAISAAILANVKSGDHVVAVESAYGPARAFLSEQLGKFGVEAAYVGGEDVSQFEQAARGNTTVFYLESPSSMVFHLQDLRKVAALAKARGIVTIIDNSWATPLCQKPLTLGIDLSVHTVSKYMGGHSDIIAGVVAGGRELMEKVFQVRVLYGGILGPMEGWLATRGLRSLALRVKAHGETAFYIASALEAHPAVRRVNYPALASHPQHELAKAQMSGFTSPLSFELDCANGEARGFVRRLKWFNVGPSWGGHESMVTVPHGDSTLVRIHTGLEDRETLWNDLKSSLDLIARLARLLLLVVRAVIFPDLDAPCFPADGLGEFRNEFHDARVLVGRGGFLHVVLELQFEGVGRDPALGENYRGFDHGAPVGFGYAGNGALKDGRVFVEGAFHLEGADAVA